MLPEISQQLFHIQNQYDLTIREGSHTSHPLRPEILKRFDHCIITAGKTIDAKNEAALGGLRVDTK